MDPLEARALFPHLDGDGVYLQHAGNGALSTRAMEAVTRVAREPLWGPQYNEDWETLRSSLASFVNVPSDDVAITRGTAHGISIVARGLDWRAGDNVVSARLEYPTNTFPWTLLKRHGVELRLADPVDGRITPEAVFALCDARTRVISISWVQFWNGFRADLAAMGAECRRTGVLFVVDGIQGIGALRLDATAAQIDVLACGAAKWLLGPTGIGFVSVRREIQDALEPPLVGAETFEVVVGEPFENLTALKPDARRYEESSISWFDIAALQAGVDVLNDVGLHVVEDRVLSLSQYLCERLAARGYQVIEPWPRTRDESSGIVSIRCGAPAEKAVRILAGHGIVARPLLDHNGVRFSPHFYNTRDELDRVVELCGEKLPA